MSSTPQLSSSLLDLIAHGGPLRSVADNQNVEADTGQRNASAALSQAQVPLVNAQTQQEQAKAQQAQIATQQAQQQIKDQQLWLQWLKLGQGAATPPFLPGSQTGPGPNAGQPAPAPPQATPTQIAQAKLPGGLINRTGDLVGGVPSLPQASAPSTAGSGELVPGMTGIRTGDLQPAAAPLQPQPGAPPQGIQAPPPQQTPQGIPSMFENPYAHAMAFAQWAGPRGGGSAQFINSLITQGIAGKKALAEADKQTLENHAAGLAIVKGAVGAYVANPTPQAAALLHQQLQENEPKVAALIKPGADGLYTPAEVAYLQGLSGQLEQALANAKTIADTKEAGSRADQADATAENTRQEAADKKRAEAAATLASATTPNEYETARLRMPASTAILFPSFNQVFDANGKQLPDAADRIRALGMSPDEQAKALQAKAQLAHEENVSSETSRHDRSDESNASGRLAVDQARNTREGQIYEQTYGAGANPALQGVEPKLRTAAAGAAQKAADEFTKAQAAQRDLETFMSSARAGNKEAHAYLSPEGVLTLNTARGVTRVNRQEMEAFAGAGSLVDHIVGKVGKLTSGQSVPSDIIDDIESLNKQLSNNSATTYNQKLSSINQNYHSNFQPVAAAADWKTQAKNAKAGEVIKLPNGHTVKANGDGTFTPQ